MASSFPNPKRNGTSSSVQRILVVDDDFDSLNVFYWILERHYTVLKAETADEAISFCHEQRADIGLLLADIFLRSAVSGTQVGLRVRECRPDIPILFSSGTPIEGWREHDFADLKALMSGRIDFIQKPFTAQMLVRKVESLLNGAFSISEMERVYGKAELYRRGLKPLAGVFY